MYRQSISKSAKILLVLSGSLVGCSETDWAAKLAGPEFKVTDCVRNALDIHDEDTARCSNVRGASGEEGASRGRKRQDF